MDLAKASFVISLIMACAWLVRALWNAWHESTREAKEEGVTAHNAAEILRLVELMREALKTMDDRSIREVETLWKAIQENNEAQNDRHMEFYKEFSEFRFQVARYMKNGGHA